MLFHNIEYFIFFFLVFLIRWYIIPMIFKTQEKESYSSQVFFLIVSYFFYMSWDYRFGALIFISTFIDYYLAIRITDTSNPKLKKLYLNASVILNLVCILGFFKYYTFLASNTNSVFHHLGWKEPLPAIKIILPVGVSFFTFQSLSYTIDVYRGIIPCERSLMRFALFVSFFPQLVAGPIVTAKTFIPQLFHTVSMEDIPYKKAVRFFFLGYFKKVLISDNIAPIIDLIFHSPDSYGTIACWLASILFIIQIYCDFSGYSDMAYSSALLLGYELPENFRLPYLAQSITEFWGGRWHISLSVWIRDYIYIPLGGSRVSYFRHKLNLFLTMVIAGFWHGANWTFIIWGTVQGFIIVIETIYRDLMKKYYPESAKKTTTAGILFRIVFCFFFIAIISTWFRAESIEKEMVMLHKMLSYSDGGLRPYMVNTFWTVMFLLITGHITGYYIFEKKKNFYINPKLEFAAYILLVFVFAIYTSDNEIPFVYFQF